MAEFTNAPLIETVLGVQFAPIKEYTSALPAWFWKNYLGPEWNAVFDAPPLIDQFETFEEQQRWAPPGILFKLEAVSAPPRVKIANGAEGRLIQLQATRFIYNWEKRSGLYPHYENVKAEFKRYFATWQRFLQDNALGEITPNQWELTYVNRVARGDLWQTPSDWHKILPGLLAQGMVEGDMRFEGFGGEWHYEIAPARGRVHVSVQFARIGAGEPVLVFQTTARGPIGKETGLDIETGLDVGHSAAIDTFLGITSGEAKRHWGMVRP